MQVKGISKNVSVAPKKLRLVLNTVRGRRVQEAYGILQLLTTPAAVDVSKAIKAAVANAENNYQLNPEALRVVSIKVDEGIKLKRFYPHARGRAGTVNKRHSHIEVVVGDEEAILGA